MTLSRVVSKCTGTSKFLRRSVRSELVRTGTFPTVFEMELLPPEEVGTRNSGSSRVAPARVYNISWDPSDAVALGGRARY